MTPRMVPLKELCNDYRKDIVDGPFGSNLKRADYKESGIPVLKIQNVKPFRITLKKMDYVGQIKFDELTRHSYTAGDIVMTKLGDPLGSCAIVDGIEDGLIVADLVRIRAKKINTRYLNYHLNSPITSDYINSQQKGTTRPRVKIEVVRNLPIYVPSSDEQERIVAILDEAFAAIDKAIANTEKNIQNARELFDSYLNNIFSNPGPDWETKRLKDFAEVCGGYSFKSTDFKKSGEYQVLRMGNVRPGCIRPSENPVFVDDAEENVLRRALLKPGDIIITQTGTKKKRDYGFTAMIDGERYLLNQRLASIRIKETAVPKFFLYFSWTDLFKDQFFANETGTVGQGNVGIGAITDSLVPVCDRARQEEIVARLDDFYQDLGRLESANTRKAAELEELRKALLQKAFSGELSL